MPDRIILPMPATLGDIYLYDIALSLRAISDKLASAGQLADTSDVALREPGSATKRSTSRTK